MSEEGDDNPAITALSGQLASLQGTVSQLQADLARTKADVASDRAGGVDMFQKVLQLENRDRADIDTVIVKAFREQDTTLGDWQIRQERFRIDELYRRLGLTEQTARERKRMFLAELGTGSTWSEMSSVGGVLATSTGMRHAPPLHVLSKRAQSFPLIELSDSTFGTAYYMADRTTTAEIIGTCTKPGTYTGKLRLSFSGFDSTDPTALTMGDFGDEGQDCIIINGAERTLTGHDLLDGGGPTSNPFPGHIIGKDDGTGLPLVCINGYDFGTCDVPDALIV